MPTRKRGNTLDRWEVAIIKAMLAGGGYNDQDILAYFTRPTRSVNHRAIGEIRTEKKHKALKAATPEELDEFLAGWPYIDPQTGLSVQGDEILIKAREAMIAAVHIFNGAGLTFRAELFIVTCIIAWTYLMHAWLKREGIDYRYKEDGAVKKTKHGAELYSKWANASGIPSAPSRSARSATWIFYWNYGMKSSIAPQVALTMLLAPSSRLVASTSMKPSRPYSEISLAWKSVFRSPCNSLPSILATLFAQKSKRLASKH